MAINRTFEHWWKAARLPILGRDLSKYSIIQAIFAMVKLYMK